MNWQKLAVIAATVAMLPASPSHALCIYKGQMYAKTTLSQEFSDSSWVVRAKVTAADDHWSDEDQSWTIYHLRVLATFKGTSPPNIDLFTFRNSGGFYLNQGSEYLLFLDSIRQLLNVPLAARSATEVNYNCGQSRAWASVSGTDREQLLALAKLNK